ncbi:MAG: ATP-binding protein, partial [Bacteroidota bacterium]
KNAYFLNLAKQNSLRLLGLVNEILDLSKLEKNQIRLVESTENVLAFFEGIFVNFKSLAQHKGVDLKFETQVEESLQVLLDRNKVEKIAINLIGNALKFTPKGGTILLSLKELPDALEFTVKDTGRGIHPDDLPNIFDRYYQTSKTDTLLEGGTGIGLAYSLELAKLMHGDLKVKSQWGKGSIFYFSFPKKVSLDSQVTITESELKKPESSREKATKDKQATILVVEDNEDLQRYLSTLLLESFQVEVASNGAVALEVLATKIERKNPLPNLILSDVMMPELDGFQLLKKLKATDTLRGIPIVMLTARTKLNDKLHALRIGVDDYLTKPFVPAELFARIENLLNNANNREYNETAASNLQSTSPTSKELMWLREIEQIVLANSTDIRFSVDDLAEAVQLGRRQLTRRVKKCTGLSPAAYIKEARLNKARELLESGKVESVKRLALEVGFLNVDYFGQQFKERFGRLPSSYL